MYNPYYFYPLINNSSFQKYGRPNLNFGRNISNISSRVIPNLSKIIDTTQKGINTYNQIVPIYNQVKPIILKVGSTTKNISKYFNSRFNRNSNIVEDAPYKEKYNKDSKTFNQTEPSSPYFK